MKTYFKGITGVRITATCKNEDGTVINLTSKTATLKVYYFGTNTLKFSSAMTTLVAADGTCYYDITATNFDAIGNYYSVILITGTGYSYTMVYDSFQIIENQENVVTISDLLAFMDVKSENAKNDESTRLYLDQAETILNLEVPSLETSTDAKYIAIKKQVIMLKAAVLYFMNSGESNINPDIRTQKIKLWTDTYNKAVENLNNALSSSSTSGSATMRRAYSSEYSDENSMYYDADLV